MLKRDTIRVDIACNHPDNGLFVGVAQAIHIGEYEFQSRAWDWAPKLTEGNGWIRIGGKSLRCSGSRYGVGNWCWTAFYCDRRHVESLMNWQRFRRWYSLDAAPIEYFGKWEAGEPLRLPTTDKHTSLV